MADLRGDGPLMTIVLRGEVESFQHLIFATIDAIVGALDWLSAEELNWRPAAPATVATELLRRPASESGTLRHEDGTHGRSDRCRRSFVLPILLHTPPET
jgi:hypothetical protein